VFAPLIAMLLVFLASGILRTSPNPTAALVVSIASLTIIGIGALGAVIGCVGIAWYGRRGLLGWSLGGLALCGLVLGFAYAGFNSARKAGKAQTALNRIKAIADEYREDVRQSFDPEAGITNAHLENIERMQTQFEDAAREASGEDAVVAKVMAAHLARSRAALNRYNGPLKELEDANVLSPATLTNQDQFATRSNIVNNFLLANEELKKFVSGAEDHIRADLLRLKLPERRADNFMRGYRNSAGGINLLVLKIRRSDTQIGTAMLEGLKILSGNWGRWKYDATTDQITFDDDQALEAYQQVLTKLRVAGEEQVQLQEQMLKLQQQQAR
jgi:hypothetical protein